MLAESPSEIEDLDTRTVGIPVHYGGDFGPDLGFVASHNELTEQQVIEIHSQPTYLVYMIGFAPGFPYLGGMSERIAAPRRDNPRASIPVGSVGVAGRQTGVYSIETPGGWQLIGRTPLRLFRPEEERPSLLEAGDEVRFDPITRSEYDRRGVFVQRGAILSFGNVVWGCRAYLAIAGGIDVPEVMGSRSTHLRAALGGYGGRALRKGDALVIGPTPERARAAMRIASEALGPLPFALSDASFKAVDALYPDGSIRFVRGPHWDLMHTSDKGAFWSDPFTISTRSDRMGYRLE